MPTGPAPGLGRAVAADQPDAPGLPSRSGGRWPCRTEPGFPPDSACTNLYLVVAALLGLGYGLVPRGFEERGERDAHPDNQTCGEDGVLLFIFLGAQGRASFSTSAEGYEIVETHRSRKLRLFAIPLLPRCTVTVVQARHVPLGPDSTPRAEGLVLRRLQTLPLVSDKSVQHNRLCFACRSQISAELLEILRSFPQIQVSHRRSRRPAMSWGMSTCE